MQGDLNKTAINGGLLGLYAVSQNGIISNAHVKVGLKSTNGIVLGALAYSNNKGFNPNKNKPPVNGQLVVESV